MKSFVYCVEPYFGPIGSAMSFYVSQALLHNAKNTQLRFLRNSRRHIFVHKINLHILLICELLAEGADSCHKSKVFECRGMQTMRQSVQVSGKFTHIIPKLVKTRDRASVCLPDGSRHFFQIDGQYRQPLRVIVVDLTSDSGPLFLLRLNQSSAQTTKSFFRCLAIGNVDSDAKHSRGIAVVVEIIFATSCDPASRSICSSDVKFCCKRFSALFGVSKSLPYNLTIRPVDSAAEVFDISGIRVRWYSENCLQITETPIFSSLEVPVPPY